MVRQSVVRSAVRSVGRSVVSSLRPYARVLLAIGVLFGAAAVGLAVAAGAPQWAVDPTDIGPDQPTGGRSAFDALVAQTVDGQERLVVPFPYENLLRLVESKTKVLTGVFNDDPTGIHKTLIPLGRSLQRKAAKPDFFLFPRIVLAVTGAESPSATDFPLLRDRLFIGYQEKAEALEVISYNELAGRFEFEQVMNYKAGATPEVIFARRGFCLRCHQNQAPIFAQRDWAETNRNPEIAARLATARAGQPDPAHFHGLPLAQNLSTPEAIDGSVARANQFALNQKLWQASCALADAGKERSCRLSALRAIFEFRLSGDANYADSDRLRSEFIEPARLKNAGLAWWAPDFHIDFRDPLKQSDPTEVLPEDEPLNPRPPLPATVALDEDGLGSLVRGLSSFFSEGDIGRLDRALALGSKTPSAVFQQTCTWSPRKVNGAIVPNSRSLNCTEPAVAIRFRASVTAGGSPSLVAGGSDSIVRAALAGCSNCEATDRVRFRGTASMRADGGWSADLEPRHATLDLAARFANADRVARVTIDADPAGASGSGTAHVTVALAPDSIAIEALLQRARSDSTDPFGGAGLSRSRVLSALAQLAAAEGLISGVTAVVSSTPRTQAPPPPPSPELAPALQVFQKRCSECHSNGIGFPTEFTDGDVAKNVEICAERILYRLRRSQGVTGMPPLIAIQDWFRRPHMKQDPDGVALWQADADYQTLINYVSGLVERKYRGQSSVGQTGAGPSGAGPSSAIVEDVLRRPYPQGPCAGNGAD